MGILDPWDEQFPLRPADVPREGVAHPAATVSHACSTHARSTAVGYRKSWASDMLVVGGVEVHLTPIEFRMLETLVRHAGKVVTQRQLLIDVWGPQHSEQAQYLRVYMAQLRRKLEADPDRPRHLRTEPGVGYRFMVE
jgi:DNA-binding response OmpR family regulator